MAPEFLAALFRAAKIGKKLSCLFIDEWIKKLWYIYIQTRECYSATKKKKIEIMYV